jgi:hypothetical protein
MTRPLLSVCVMAADAAADLEKCLEAVPFADEITVLLDARHGDVCRGVAQKFAHRVESHAYEGDLDQRRRSIALARGDWVLVLDPDERVSTELARSIERAIAQAPAEVSGYELDRVTHHLGRWILHGDFYPDWKLRLFRRGRARVVGHDPHGRIEVDGKCVRIDGRLEHYSYKSLEDQMGRIRFFSDEAARALHAAGRRAGIRQLVLHPPARFLRCYLLKRGFLDGWPGFIVAAMSSFYVFLKYAKLWERTRGGADSPSAVPPGS